MEYVDQTTLISHHKMCQKIKGKVWYNQNKNGWMAENKTH